MFVSHLQSTGSSQKLTALGGLPQIQAKAKSKPLEVIDDVSDVSPNKEGNDHAHANRLGPLEGRTSIYETHDSSAKRVLSRKKSKKIHR